jgi:predicted dehydrogenase
MAHERNGISRRHFFFGSLFAAAVPAAGYGSAASLKQLGYKSPNEKLNIAAIGAGGRPLQVMREFDNENIVALADVDWARGSAGFTQFPNAAKYKDFRRMLDKSAKDIDAVLIGTPDHNHAVCAVACMQLGKHVYVEKPLTRTSWEARMLRQAAEKYPVATQMGNQGYSHDATRVACEIFWSGEIGEVREVHAWMRRAVWPQGMEKIASPTPVPETLDWDLWLGGAAWREFTAGDEPYRQFVEARTARGGARPGGGGGPAGAPGGGRGGFGAREEYGFYLPFNWRGFYDFGSGLIGDWGVHILGPANWALQLGPESLLSVECVEKDSHPPFTFPDYLKIRYEFAARGNMPPVTVYWHNVDEDAYLPPDMTAEQARKIPDAGPQVGPAGGGRGFGGPGGPARGPGAGGGAGRPEQEARSGYNCIFVGSKGYLGTSGRGEGVGLLPGSRWAEYKLPEPYLTRSPGASTGSNGGAHARDWVRAAKGGTAACSNFSIGAPYTEWLVLGAAAVHYEGKLLWDNAKGEFSNNKDANQWVKPTFRKGWEIKV